MESLPADETRTNETLIDKTLAEESGAEKSGAKRPGAKSGADGLLILDKPGGMSSHDAVNKVRRLFDERSVGHLGTLDPMATGVLPLLLGRYTRLAQYFGRPEKEYCGAIRFGYATDTYDAEGEPATPAQPVHLNDAWLHHAVAGMHGELQQTPPPFSAKKVKGVPAHRLARKGQPQALQAVPITVTEFSATIAGPDTVSFHVTVSAGGYIRCLAHDLGQQLGCGAHLASLRRVRAGTFLLGQAVTLDHLAALEPGQRKKLLLPTSSILTEIPKLSIDEITATRIRNGAQMNLPDFSNAPLLRLITADGTIVAIARRLAGTLFAPQTVLA